MERLDRMNCSPLTSTSVQLSDDQIGQLKDQISSWELSTVDGVKRLYRIFKFTNFSDALAFTTRVGNLADKQDHHPSLLTEWGKVTVTWWTHKVKGLHMNDFIMAAKTDGLYMADSSAKG